MCSTCEDFNAFSEGGRLCGSTSGFVELDAKLLSTLFHINDYLFSKSAMSCAIVPSSGHRIDESSFCSQNNATKLTLF